MKQTEQNTVYSRSYRLFHWAMGLGFAALLIAGQQFNLNLSEAYKISGLQYHSSLGLVVLLSAVILLVKRFLRGDPRPAVNLQPLQKLAANSAQISLYFLAVYVPVTGLITAMYSHLPTKPFGLFNLSFMANEQLFSQIRTAHELGTFAAIFLVSAHIAAALHHHFIKKDAVLIAMTGNLKRIVPKRLTAAQRSSD
ncbi:cytochrome b [Reinekea marinisedimentorum]|uniref:Cytochrome b561 n=1 Tax=Reinekea marinisedimentorum TaxID=230495 RepID=A0A4V2UIM5_9GAMM|nr:cytochrome b/b6 domain-containing protein [Reinekea marinisedimentorum]TCS36760.1 cytochrome b561 [Reinekea marinisedimentorum]